MGDLIGRDLSRYHILEQLGEGGMATVYRAYDTRLERDVAIKVIRTDQFAPAMLDRILKRFEREAKALARLTHANIVHINDYGEQDGIPYLVMDYLPGGTLKQLISKPVPWREAVHFLLPIARALDFAHRQGMIHRDVKTSNILITADGDPMLTDFGIAKILDVEAGQTLTGTGIGIGTPEYMAPEQWVGKVTPQSDVYSLGVVFYEMVTCQKPYTAETPAAVLIKQTNDPLPRPRQFVPGLPGEVEKVLFRALAKQPEDRYPTMGDLAVALEGLLAGQAWPSLEGKSVEAPQETVVAPSRQEEPRVGPVRGSPGARFLPEATIDGGLEQDVGGPPGIPMPGEAPSRQPAMKNLKPWAIGLGALLLVVVITTLVILLRQRGTAAPVSPPINPALTGSPGALTSTTVPASVISAGNAGQVKELARGSNGIVNQVAYAPDGHTIVVASSTGITLYSAGSLGQVRFMPTDARASSVAFSPDGKMLAAGSGDNTILLWDTASGQLLRTLKGHTYPVTSVAFSPDGKTLASGSVDNTVILWDLASGQALRTLKGHSDSVNSVAFSPDGKMLASASNDKTITLWDVHSGQAVGILRWHTSPVYSVAFSPDGKMLASASYDHTAVLWDLASGQTLHILKGHGSAVLSVAFSPDGKTLASASDDKTIILWDVASGQALHTLNGHTSYVYSVAFSPDGKTLASGSRDGTLRIWGVAP